MADSTLSPNMSLPVPTVGEAPGRVSATDLNASLSIIDSHNHSAGQGVQINPAGININTDFSFNSNNATVMRSVNFIAQGAPLALSTDIGCVYVSGVDLYYNDENGNQIRITQSGSVAGSAGTITGLPSGTASASYSAGTFTFQGATNTPASINVGPVVLGNATANSKTVTLSPNVGIAANYNLSLPAALPASLNYVTLDNSGNLSFNSSGLTGSGAVVLATSATITTPSIATATFTGLTTVSASGIAFTSGTMVDYAEGTWTSTVTVTGGSGSANATGSGSYNRIGNKVYCTIGINVQATVASFSITLPVAPANNFSSNNQAQGNYTNGGGGFTSSVCSGYVFSVAGTKNAACSLSNTSSSSGVVFSGVVSFSYIRNT